MNKQAMFAVLIVALAVSGLWNLSFMMGQNNTFDLYQKNQEFIDPILEGYQRVMDRFYRIEDVDHAELFQGSLRGLMEELDDPYSNYFSPEEFERFNRGLEGEFVGVGINIGIRDDRLTIVSPIQDSPAHQAGARAGDIILQIDDTNTEGMTLDEAISLLRGERGTEVTMEVLHRDGSIEPLQVVRDVIRVPTVEVETMADGKIGYIRLFTFNENAGQDVRNAISQFHRDGVEGIVFDLRDNGGGLLSEAINISSQFIDTGRVVTTTGPAGVQEYNTRGNSWRNVPVAVLINGGSASASEIVAGALQDTNMGVLVGQQSFGKGVVQTLFPLEDGSYLRLTTSEYLTPNDRHVQGDGLTPDLMVADPLELLVDARMQLMELKMSLYTKDAHMRVDGMLDQLNIILNHVENDNPAGETDTSALLLDFRDAQELLLSASDNALVEALAKTEMTLVALQDSMTHSSINTAIDWLLNSAGQLCPCEVPGIAQP